MYMYILNVQAVLFISIALTCSFRDCKKLAQSSTHCQRKNNNTVQNVSVFSRKTYHALVQ